MSIFIRGSRYSKAKCSRKGVRSQGKGRRPGLRRSQTQQELGEMGLDKVRVEEKSGLTQQELGKWDWIK